MDETTGLKTVKNFMNQIDDGTLVIPYFQRSFEWKPKMVCELIESILQNYYTGLILLWELDSKEVKNEKWDKIWGANKISKNPRRAILDGQQRLSSLYYAIYNPQTQFPNRSTYYNFYIDLVKVMNGEFDGSVDYKYSKRHINWNIEKRGIDEWIKKGIFPIEMLSANDDNLPNYNYIKSTEFEEIISKFRKEHKINLPEGASTARCINTLERILDYSFVYHSLDSKRNLPDICNIFARVNEKGMKLSTFDLMNAFLYSKGVHLRKRLWDKLDNDQLKDIDNKMNEYLLKIISLNKQKYCSSKYIYNLVPKTKIIKQDSTGKKKPTVLVEDAKEFKKLWKNSTIYAEKAREIIMNVGENEFGAIKHEFIPNSTIIPVLAAILWKGKSKIKSKTTIKKLEQWYWSAIISEDYSGSSDSVMSKDYRDWCGILNREKDATIERINKVNKDFIESIDFQSVKKGSARYRAVISLLALNGSKDFYNGRIVGTGDYDKSQIDDHHIFPKKIEKLDSKKSKKFKNTKDMIVNRTLLFNKTNSLISNKKPSVYIKNMIKDFGLNKTKNIFKKHFINEKAFNHLKADDYDNFIIEREKEIKKALIKKMGLLDKD